MWYSELGLHQLGSRSTIFEPSWTTYRCVMLVGLVADITEIVEAVTLVVTVKVKYGLRERKLYVGVASMPYLRTESMTPNHTPQVNN